MGLRKRTVLGSSSHGLLCSVCSTYFLCGKAGESKPTRRVCERTEKQFPLELVLDESRELRLLDGGVSPVLLTKRRKCNKPVGGEESMARGLLGAGVKAVLKCL